MILEIQTNILFFKVPIYSRTMMESSAPAGGTCSGHGEVVTASGFVHVVAVLQDRCKRCEAKLLKKGGYK